jgi:cell division protein FtsL
MVTTRRTSTDVTSSVLDRSTSGGVDVLERVRPAINEFNSNIEETEDQARARMRGNLDMLLNYDRYSETVIDSVDTPVVEEAPAVVAEAVELQDEDIRPTSTTMQFGDADVDQIYNEMHREEEKTSGKYKLNAKGKVIVVLYALAVTVILALIIINTGVLARLNGAKEAKVAELNSKMEQFQELSAEVDNISRNEYVIEQAIQQGMVKGN